MINDIQTSEREQEQEMTFKQLFNSVRSWCHYLLRRWYFLVLAGIIGAVSGFCFAYFKPIQYTATTTFVLEDDKGSGGGLGNLAGLASMAGVDLGAGASIFQGDNIVELYRSRKMIEKTLLTDVNIDGKSTNLLQRYISYNKLNEEWAKDPKLARISFASDYIPLEKSFLVPNRLRDSVITSIINAIAKNSLSVGKLDKKLSIIKVDVKSPDETFAKLFNDNIVYNVNKFYLQTKTKKSLQNVNIIQRKTDSVRAVMNGAIYTAASVADATPNLNPTRQTQRVAPVQKAQFSAETNRAILGSLVQNLEMSKVSLMKETPLLEIIDQPVYPLFKEKASKLKYLILGGIVFSLLAVIIMVGQRMFKDALI
ncbi:GumC domain-containing protein [Pedobacter rhizosphaerae]|uniref:Chain length determinant protein n=1 Tax=Pedobacter rhizosphaerae TaxID=390241 RepID=A0A1H9U3I8_9SPHI|nr:lipopolysaccharide biosynthesis protein [Pedobacter rhizosphaerae]SES03798.1 Chain length determinant protein [Pedobacter rhizosphaerae]